MTGKIEKKVQIVKMGVSLVVGLGASAIVKNLVKSTTPSNTNPITKLCIGVAAFVVGSMIADKVTDYTDDKVEKAAFCVLKIQNEIEIIKSQIQEI